MNPRNKLFPSSQEFRNSVDTILSMKLWIFLSILLFTWNCQHARIRVIPNQPKECIPWSDKQKQETCIKALDLIRSDLAKKPTSVKEYPQIYTYWGFRPDDIQVDLNKECPKGVYEIHQYSTLKNAVYEQLTIGFYSPRTLRLTCYE